VNGQRDSQPHDGKHANQLCTSNPDLIAEFARRVREYLDTHDVDVLSISPNDGSGFCECENCRALDSGEMLSAATGSFPLSLTASLPLATR